VRGLSEAIILLLVQAAPVSPATREFSQLDSNSDVFPDDEDSQDISSTNGSWDEGALERPRGVYSDGEGGAVMEGMEERKVVQMVERALESCMSGRSRRGQQLLSLLQAYTSRYGQRPMRVSAHLSPAALSNEMIASTRGSMGGAHGSGAFGGDEEREDVAVAVITDALPPVVAPRRSISRSPLDILIQQPLTGPLSGSSSTATQLAAAAAAAADAYRPSRYVLGALHTGGVGVRGNDMLGPKNVLVCQELKEGDNSGIGQGVSQIGEQNASAHVSMQKRIQEGTELLATPLIEGLSQGNG